MVNAQIFASMTSPARDNATIVFHHLAAKWSIPVILVLGSGTHRFNHLLRSVPGISHRLLAVTVRQLERDGLIRRKATDTAPTHVEYSLTPLGIGFESLVKVVIGWANVHGDAFRPDRGS